MFKIIIGFASLVVAFSSLIIAYIRYKNYIKFESIKFRTDLYEKRYRIYKAVKNMISQIKIGIDNPQDWQNFFEEYIKTDEAKFIFNGNEKIDNYIEEVYHNGNKIYTSNKFINSDRRVSEKIMDKERKKYGEVLEWVDDQFSIANQLFTSYLKIKDI